MSEQLLRSWRVGQRGIEPVPRDELDIDPRGILWMYEEPRQTAAYVVGCDPTVGKPGWNRWLRTDDDIAIDNAVIQVLRRTREKDIQVAEFAAPIDAIDIAPVCNAVGRLYKGNSEDGMAPMIVEATGPGAITIRELVDKFGYTNQFLWHYYAGSMTPKAANSGDKIGWYSSRGANKDLWMRGVHHIHKGNAQIYSEHCIEEMADCLADAFTLIGEARYGRHDDRVFAMLLALWLANGWSTGGIDENEPSPVRQTEQLEAQESDMDYEEMVQSWNERVSDY